jgi:hypothetical protein
MHLRRGFLGFFALLCTVTTSASARYILDPDDLPKDFKCDDDDSAEKCQKDKVFEAWWNKYHERNEKWHFALGHNPDLFFNTYDSSDDPDDEDFDPRQGPFSMLDIHYEIALRRYSGWTLAINMECPETKAKDWRKQCRPLLRMSKPIYFDPADPETSKKYKALNAKLEARGRPISQAEAAEDYQITQSWIEADLSTCKGALSHLRKFPGLTQKLWATEYLNWLDGSNMPNDKEDDERDIIVTADGDGFVIRATGRANPSNFGIARTSTDITISESNGGNNYDWAKELALVVEPCMKPATVPAPWDKYLEWLTKKKSVSPTGG